MQNYIIYTTQKSDRIGFQRLLRRQDWPLGTLLVSGNRVRPPACAWQDSPIRARWPITSTTALAHVLLRKSRTTIYCANEQKSKKDFKL